MIRTLENLIGYRILARDGEIGKVYDFFIDDSLWKLRYVVAETGNWMNRQRVLLSLAALGEIQSGRREFHVNLTRDQLKDAPGIDTDKPVSRQQELMMNLHYGWPAYWSLDAFTVPAQAVPPARIDGDQHLRSFREISAYEIGRGEEPLGRVEDIVIDDSDWTLKKVIMTRGGWLSNQRVAIPAGAIQSVSWTSRSIFLKPSDPNLSDLDPFDFNDPVNRQESVQYFDYYGRPAQSAPGTGPKSS